MSTLKISKDFHCSRERLFSAWTDPEQLKQWWKPLGKQLVAVENNMVKGGSVKYGFDDDSLSITGNYDTVVERDLLEYTWNWHSSLEPIHDAAYKLSVRFDGDENNSKISIAQDGFESEESIQPHQHGWEQGLDQLRSFLENREQPEQGTATQEQHAPVAGYHELPEQAKVGGG